MAKQTKKTAKPAKAVKTVKKTTIKPAPVMEHKCDKGCPCGCHQHCAGHRLKHIMILVIVFVLGYACGKIFCLCPMRKHMTMPRYSHPVFTNGCLDMQKIHNTKFQEQLMKADVNEDGCVSIEEYQAFKAKWADNKGPKKPGMFFNMKHHPKHGPKNAQPQQQ